MLNDEFCTYQQAYKLKCAGYNEPIFTYYTQSISNRTVNENKPVIRMTTHMTITPIRISNTDFAAVDSCNISAPTLAQAAAWLRSRGWHVQPMLNGIRTAYFVRVLQTVANGVYVDGHRQFDTYECALSHGIDIAIKQLTKTE